MGGGSWGRRVVGSWDRDSRAARCGSWCHGLTCRGSRVAGRRVVVVGQRQNIVSEVDVVSRYRLVLASLLAQS